MAEETPNADLEVELARLLNSYSVENDSGTPDYILAQYMLGSLHVFNATIRARSEWRGESVELPALQQISMELRKKKVPLVIYTDGKRNEIGEAEVEQWPGEVRVSGHITGVVPMFGVETHGHYSIG